MKKFCGRIKKMKSAIATTQEEPYWKTIIPDDLRGKVDWLTSPEF